MKEGGWFLQCPHGQDPENKTLGIVGLGGIGKALAARVKPLGMRVVYFNRRRLAPEEEEKLSVQYAPFEELLGSADVVSVHVPLSDATKGLIGKAEFGKMKKGVVVINTARGGIVDEEAAREALEEEKVAVYAGDVWEGEPKGVREEWRDGRWGGRVVALPHVGTHTTETRGKMEIRGLRNLVAAVGKKEVVFGEEGKKWKADVVPEMRDEEWARLD